MRKNLQLYIPDPCQENWNKMTPVDKGRFCASCQKKVVDFTVMSDEQLVAFFKKQNTSSVCGRFIQDQLQRNIAIPREKIPWLKYFFQFALPAFLFSKNLAAQGKVKMVTADTIKVPATSEAQALQKPASDYGKEKLIMGKVADDRGEGIGYATLMIKGTTFGTITDSAGNFLLKYSGTETRLILVTSSIGFETVETGIDVTKTIKKVTTHHSADKILGEIRVVASAKITCQALVMGGAFSKVKIEKARFIDTLRNKIFPVKQLVNFYPNPLQANSVLTIEVGKNEEGRHLFSLYSANGHSVFTKELYVEKANRIFKINIPSIPGGSYFLQLLNQRTGKATTEKIIVD